MADFTLKQEESLDPALQLIRIHDTLNEGESGITKLSTMLAVVPEVGSPAEQLLAILNYSVPVGKVVDWYVHIHLKVRNAPERPPIIEEPIANVTP